MARLEASDARGDTAKVLDRCALTARARVCALVGDALAQAGIDPTCVRALRPGEAAQSGRGELASHSDPLAAPSLTRPRLTGRDECTPSGTKVQFGGFVASDGDSLARVFAAKIGDISRRYEDGREPDFANASLAELLAWSLARPQSNLPRRQGGIGAGMGSA